MGQEMKIPAKHHQAVVTKVVAKIVDVGDAGRPKLWSFFAEMFTQDILERASLFEGLKTFMEVNYEDILLDVPLLPNIITDELLQEISGTKNLLSSSEVTQLKEQMVAS